MIRTSGLIENARVLSERLAGSKAKLAEEARQMLDDLCAALLNPPSDAQQALTLVYGAEALVEQIHDLRKPAALVLEATGALVDLSTRLWKIVGSPQAATVVGYQRRNVEPEA